MLSFQRLKGMQNKYHLFLYCLLLKQEGIAGKKKKKRTLETTNPF